jgi:hypothetical protein
LTPPQTRSAWAKAGITGPGKSNICRLGIVDDRASAAAAADVKRRDLDWPKERGRRAINPHYTC